MNTSRQSSKPHRSISFFTKEKPGNFSLFKRKMNMLCFTLLEIIIVVAIIAILALLAISAYNSSKCGAYKNALSAAVNNCRQSVSNDAPKVVEDCLSGALKELR